MDLVVFPIIIGACCVLITYLVQRPVKNDKGIALPDQTNYFVIFCCGLIIGFVGKYLFSTTPDESLNQVMKEIDILEPDF